MPQDAFADLESAREAVLAEAERFVEELEPALGDSLAAGYHRFLAGQQQVVQQMNEATRRALDEAVGRASDLGAAQVIERLRGPEIWLAPLTAPHLVARVDGGWPDWLPEWLAKAFGRGDDRPQLGELDDPSNRIWVAISSAARPIDPVLEEFGFEPGLPRLGGGRFGIQPRSLPQLDPSGALGQRWGRYRAAFERMSALAGSER